MSEFRYDPEQEALLPVNGGKRDRTRFIVMKEGQIVFFGTRQELEGSTDDYVKRFVRHEENHAQ